MKHVYRLFIGLFAIPLIPVGCAFICLTAPLVMIYMFGERLIELGEGKK